MAGVPSASKDPFYLPAQIVCDLVNLVPLFSYMFYREINSTVPGGARDHFLGLEVNWAKLLSFCPCTRMDPAARSRPDGFRGLRGGR
jgi:hypothetical protein